MGDDVDMAVVGYVTRDTIVNIDEAGERHPYHSVGGVSSYFSLVAANLGHRTGVVSPVGEEFRRDYLPPDAARAYGLSEERAAELRSYVESHQGDAARLERDLASKLPSEYGLEDAAAARLAHDAAYGSIFTPLLNERRLDLTGAAAKGEANSQITVLVPKNGYTVGIAEHRLPAIRPEDVPEGYLGARGIHIGPLFGEVPLETVRYLRERTDAVISLDAQGYIRHLNPFSGLSPDAVERLKGSGATDEERARWVRDDAELVTLGPWEEIGEFARYVDVMKMNEFEAVTCAGVAAEGDKLSYVDRAMERLEERLLGANRDLVLMVTMGGDGMYLSFEKHGRRVREHVRPVPARVVDTTGAGDTTAAAFLAEYMATRDVQSSARFAAAAGALAVETEGPFACPTEGVVRGRMADTYARLAPEDLDTPNWLQYAERVRDADAIRPVELADGFSREDAERNLERAERYLEAVERMNWSEGTRDAYRASLARLRDRLEERLAEAEPSCGEAGPAPARASP